jgi:cytochrome P450
MPTGDQWKRHRKLIQPGFGPTHLAHTAEVTVTVANRLNECLKDKVVDGMVSIDMFKMMEAAIIDIIGPVLFGYNEFNAIDNWRDGVSNYTSQIVESAAQLINEVLIFNNSDLTFLILFGI